METLRKPSIRILKRRVLERLQDFCKAVDEMQTSCYLLLDYKVNTVVIRDEHIVVLLVWHPPQLPFTGDDKHLLKMSQITINREYGLRDFEVFLRVEQDWAKNFIPA